MRPPRWAIVMLLEMEKTVVEGAGAAGLAALLAYPQRFKGKQVGLILCGGNIDLLMLAEIIERGMVRSGRLTRLLVEDQRSAGVAGQSYRLHGNCQREHRGCLSPAQVYPFAAAVHGRRIRGADARSRARGRNHCRTGGGGIPGAPQ